MKVKNCAIAYQSQIDENQNRYGNFYKEKGITFHTFRLHLSKSSFNFLDGKIHSSYDLIFLTEKNLFYDVAY